MSLCGNSSNEENTPLTPNLLKHNDRHDFSIDEKKFNAHKSTIFSRPKLTIPMFNGMNTGAFIDLPSSSDDSDVEQPRKFKSHKSSNKQTTTTIRDARLRRSPRISKKLPDTSDSDSDNERECTKRCKKSGSRSPTPPPDVIQPLRPKRRSRAVKNTLIGLAKIRRITKSRPKFQSLDDSGSLLDVSNDCVILDGTLSTSTTPVQAVKCKVRVNGPSGVQRFTVPQNEPFQHIFDQMSEIEGIPTSSLLMFVNDHTIDPYDTPQSINLTVADTVECHLSGDSSSQNTSLVYNDLDTSLVKVCVQGKNKKDNITVVMKKSDSMLRLMHSYAKKVSQDLSQLTFHFDGYPLLETDTPDSLDIENDDCVDVVCK